MMLGVLMALLANITLRQVQVMARISGSYTMRVVAGAHLYKIAGLGASLSKDPVRNTLRHTMAIELAYIGSHPIKM